MREIEVGREKNVDDADAHLLAETKGKNGSDGFNKNRGSVSPESGLRSVVLTNIREIRAQQALCGFSCDEVCGSCCAAAGISRNRVESLDRFKKHETTEKAFLNSSGA